MFGTGSTEAQERLVAAGHGALSTYDLYRLIRGVQRKEITLTPEALLRFLTPTGILDFEQFKASLPEHQ